MGRPVYPHELVDTDFSWLINSYRENNPHSILIESTCLPLVLIRDESPKAYIGDLPPPPVLATEDSEHELVDHGEKD